MLRPGFQHSVLPIVNSAVCVGTGVGGSISLGLFSIVGFYGSSFAEVQSLSPALRNNLRMVVGGVSIFKIRFLVHCLAVVVIL